MMVVLLIASIVSAAAGNWWLTAACWGAAVLIGTAKVRAEGRRIQSGVDAHPSQLRARQLEHIANQDRVS